VSISQDQIDQAAAEGITITRIPPPPPDYKAILTQAYHVLRGVQVAIQNQGMIPERLREVVYKGCIDGLVNHLTETLQPVENTLEIVLQAIGIQRAVRARL
jgi:hypothetical protein